jgi:hypothetical protein
LNSFGGFATFCFLAGGSSRSGELSGASRFFGVDDPVSDESLEGGDG